MMHLAKKAFYKLVGLHPLLDRLVRYRNPKDYWNKRGGDTYFAEQEAVAARTKRSAYITTGLKKYDWRSAVEIGCGYGKQLRNLYREGTRLTGCDFSRPQLLKAREHCAGLPIDFVETDAEAIPLRDESFDLAFSSAVILHNDYEKAKQILSEMIRVSRRYLAHNEDTDVTFSRYGYDMKKTYTALGFKVLESGPISCAQNPEITQFTVVELPSPEMRIEPEAIPLQYH